MQFTEREQRILKDLEKLQDRVLEIINPDEDPLGIIDAHAVFMQDLKEHFLLGRVGLCR